MASTYPPPVKAARSSHIVLAGLAIALTAINLRTAVTGFTPLLETIGADLGYGVKVSGLLGTVPAASFAVFGFFAPVLTRKFGLERSAAFALCLTTLALVVRAGSQNTIGLVLSTVLALAGIGAANVVVVPLVKAWFSNRLALWTSLYLVLMQTGQFLAPLIAVPVARGFTWRVSVGMWAIPAGIAALAWLILAIRLPPNLYASPTEAARTVGYRIGRSGIVWGLVILFGMMSLSNYGIITWVPAVLTDAGASADLGGTMVALYSAWGMVAALTVPQLATRMRNPFPVVVLCGAFLLVGYSGLLLAPLNATFVWVCALGIGVSTFPLCMTLINHRTKTSQTASTVSGFVQGLGYAIACVGPFGLGLIRDATGSWTAPLLALAATTIPGVIAGWFACRPRFVEDSVPALAAPPKSRADHDRSGPAPSRPSSSPRR